MEYYEDEPLNEALFGVGLRQAARGLFRGAPKVADKVSPETMRQAARLGINNPANAARASQTAQAVAGASDDAANVTANTLRANSSQAAKKGFLDSRWSYPIQSWGNAGRTFAYPFGAVVAGGAVSGAATQFDENNQIRKAREEHEAKRQAFIDAGEDVPEDFADFDPSSIEQASYPVRVTRGSMNAGTSGIQLMGGIVQGAHDLTRAGTRFLAGSEKDERRSVGQVASDVYDAGREKADEVSEKIKENIPEIGTRGKAALGIAAAVAAGAGGVAMNRRLQKTRWLSTRCSMTKTPQEKSACEQYVYQHEMSELQDEKNRCTHANDPVNCEERINKQMEELKNEFETI